MRRAIHILQIVLFFAALAAPELNRRLHWVAERPLDGVTPATQLPVWKFGEIYAGHAQDTFDAWYNANLGFRSYAVLLDNTLTFRLFGETPAASKVVVGNHGYLFIDEDVASYNRIETRPETELQAEVTILRNLHEALRARGKTSVVIVSPIKTTLFPDEISWRWKRQVPAPRPLDIDYRRFRTAVEQNGIPFTDGRHIVEQMLGKTDRDLLYGPRARHWSYLAACVTLKEAMTHVARDLHTETPSMDCSGAFMRAADRVHVDSDLWRLLNVWSRPDEQLPAQLWHDRDGAAAAGGLPRSKLRALFVGTSFTWELLSEADRHELFADSHWVYYNSGIRATRGPEQKMPKVGTPEWNDFVFSHDVFILESPEMWLTGFGSGFPQQAIDALRAMPAAAQ